MESGNRLLASIPGQSTLSQYIRSEQAALGKINSQSLSGRNQVSDEAQRHMLKQVRQKLTVLSDLYQDDFLALRSLLKLDFSPETTGFHYLSSEISRLTKSNLTYAVTFTNGVVEAPTREVSQITKDDVIRDVAQYLGEVSIDMRTHESVERQVAVSNESNDQDFRPVAKLLPAALGLFTKHFYGTGLYYPVEAMLARLCLQMQFALALDLHSVYVPFLQELIGLMLMYGIPMKNSTYSAFFNSVLCNYFDRFVGTETTDKSSAEHDSWTQRGNAARIMLESFDHSYFQDILGPRYESNILPAFTELPTVSQSRSRFDSLTAPSLS